MKSILLSGSLTKAAQLVVSSRPAACPASARRLGFRYGFRTGVALAAVPKKFLVQGWPITVMLYELARSISQNTKSRRGHPTHALYYFDLSISCIAETTADSIQ
jgi:hypothetical protein